MLFELAFTLRMPAYKILQDLPYDELLGWFEYLESRPIGWREDLRTVYLLNAQGVKNPEKLFPALAKKNTSDNPTDSFVGSKLHHFLKNAKGGDAIL